MTLAGGRSTGTDPLPPSVPGPRPAPAVSPSATGTRTADPVPTGPAVADPTADPTAEPDPSEAASATLVQRGGWSLVWLAVLTTGVNFWGGWTAWPGTALWAPVLVLMALCGLAATWLVDPGSRRFQGAGIVTAAMAVVIPQGSAIHARTFFATDSAAFNQYATRLLVAGRNPYTASMRGADYLLNPPGHFWSYTTDGSFVSHVSYPAGSFLLQAPFMALGFHHELTDWVDLGAWLVTGALLVVLLPARLRWLALLVFLTGWFAGVFADGGTDALFLPFLVVAVWRWDRFATRPDGGWARAARWAGPVALGLACAIKQTPWFCVPFLVLGVAIAARRQEGRAARAVGIGAAYLATVAGVFLAVNLPFIVWSPGAWVRGVVLPFTGSLVADGQGLVGVALHGLTGGVSLTLLALAGAFAVVALLMAFVVWEPRLRRIWLLLLPVALFVPGRSLASYLLDMVPAGLVAAVSVPALSGSPRLAAHLGRETAAGSRRRGVPAWIGPALVGAAVVVTVGTVVVAFRSAPLEVQVVGVRTSDHTQSLDAVRVRVTNTTGTPVRGHFMVVDGAPHPTGFWVADGHRPSSTSVDPGVSLAPGATITVTLRPTEFTWSPTLGQYWVVQVYTPSPNALSTSPALRWALGKPQ